MFWSNLIRLFHIVRVVSAHAASRWGGRWLSRVPVLGRRLPPVDLSGPDRFRIILEEIGGTFIKFGQVLALQPDVLNLAYCNALFDLMDRVAPFGYDQVEKIFLQETGKKPDQLFDAFGRRPMATASIGQVHAAVLTGQSLVVKVQRPNVDTDFRGDIRLMKLALKLIRQFRIASLYWLIEPVTEFVAWTEEELDYRSEARYMDQLRRNARENTHEHIPAVTWPLTTRRILTMEYLEGVTVVDYLRLLQYGDIRTGQRLRDMDFEPDQFARHIIDNFLGDAFLYGIFHADLHPANLLIMSDNTVGYVDFGITGMLSHYSRRELVALTLAYTRADLDGMCRSFFRVSVLDRNSDIPGFRRGLQQHADDWYEARGDHRRLKKNFTLVMLDMLTLSKKTGIWPERDVIKYIRSAITIDGLITRFAPNFDVGAYLAKTCAEHLRNAHQPILSAESLMEWSFAGNRLIREGGQQVVAMLHRYARPKKNAGGQENMDTRKHQTAFLGFFLILIAGLMTLMEEPAIIGFNLFTVETGLGVAALLLMMQTLYRAK